MIAHFYFPLFASSKSHKEQIAQESDVATRIMCQWINTSCMYIIISLSPLVLSCLLYPIIPQKAQFWGKSVWHEIYMYVLILSTTFIRHIYGSKKSSANLIISLLRHSCKLSAFYSDDC